MQETHTTDTKETRDILRRASALIGKAIAEDAYAGIALPNEPTAVLAAIDDILSR